MYLVYSLRFALGIITAFIIHYATGASLTFSIIAGLIVYIALLISFRVRFLKGMSSVKRIDKIKRDSIIVRTAKGMETWRICALIVVAIGIIALSIVYIKNNTYGLTGVVMFSIIALLAAVYIVINIISLVYKYSHNE